MKNSPLSTSFRSVTQATDSARSGWTANTAATNALGHETACHPPKNQEQQDRRGGVEQHVGQVMGRGAVAQKVPDEHVRHARQRGPAFQVALGKCRPDAPQRQFAVTSRFS